MSNNFALFEYPSGVRKAVSTGFKNIVTLAVFPVSYRYTVRGTLPVSYAFRNRSVLPISYAVGGHVRSYVKPSYAVYPGAYKVAYSLPVSYGYKLRKSVSAGYGYANKVRAILPTSYFNLSKVTGFVPATYDSKTGYTVRGTYRARYVSNPYAIVSTISNQPTVTVNGVVGTIVGGEVFSDEGDGLWKGTFTVAGMETYLASQLGVPATVQLGVDTYFMFVDSRSLRMSGPAQIDTEISLVSAGSFLSEPRATLKSFAIDTDMLASQFADILADPVGIDWEMPDWLLTAGVKSWDNVAPMTVLKELVEAAGGVVDALPSGRLVARPKFPVSPSGYLTAVPAVVLYSVADALDITEEHTTLALYGTFRIMNEAAELQDMLEYVKDENDTSDLSGFLRAYPRPYRTNIELVHTSDANIILGAGQWVYRDEEQEIEILGGEGSVQFPIVSILSTVWNDNSAGGTITAGYYQNKVVVTGGSGYGLLKIKYRTLALVYGVRSLAADTSQFLLQEV